jgi:hypothetical protein
VYDKNARMATVTKAVHSANAPAAMVTTEVLISMSPLQHAPPCEVLSTQS